MRGVAVALALFAAFGVGLALRGPLHPHFALLFRIQFGLGLGLLAVLAGWSFDITLRNVTALLVLAVAQVAGIVAAAWTFRRRRDGPLLAFGVIGNPTYWSVPMAAATLGPRAAVFLAAYDMLTQPRVAVAVKLMRGNAPVAQSARTALADYAPMAGAVSGLLLGRLVPAPPGVTTAVAVTGVVLSLLGALLVGVAWPRHAFSASADPAGGRPIGLALRGLAFYLTVVPALLAAASVVGVGLPAGVWILVLGPWPLSMLSFAQLYGYSLRLASIGLALSTGLALGLLPLAVSLGRSG